MPMQMQLWTAPNQSFQFHQIWKDLENQQQKDIITALANLICKMVVSQGTDQEESHER
jgi:hypothetical protein